MAGGGQTGEVTAFGQRKQATSAHGAGGSFSQRTKAVNAIGGVRRQLATQVTETVSVFIEAGSDSVMISE